VPNRSSEELRQAFREIEACINRATAILDPSQLADDAAIVELDHVFSIISALRRQIEEGRWPGRRVTSFPPGWEETPQ